MNAFIARKIHAAAIIFILLASFSCRLEGAEEKTDPAPITDPAPESPAPEEAIVKVVSGARVVTGGWADHANGGTGVSYMNPASITFITDGLFPAAKNKRIAFTGAIYSSVDAPRIIVVEGDIDLSDALISDTDKTAYTEFSASGNRLHNDIVYPISSNTTIIGVQNARIMFGGLKINAEKNIIIRNLTFYDAHGSTAQDTGTYPDSKASIDALSVEGSSATIWVDHCTFTDGLCSDLVRNLNHDGAFDIKQGQNITVSWCEFTNHDKVMLVGSDDTNYTLASERQITLHHNYFHGTTQRTPRSRGCQMHIYNNYYDNIGIAENTGSCLGPGISSQYIVENNNFGSRLGPIVKYYDKTTSPAIDTFSLFYHAGNTPAITAADCTFDTSTDYMKDFSAHVSAVKPWVVPYSYTLEGSTLLPGELPSHAGSRQTVSVNGKTY